MAASSQHLTFFSVEIHAKEPKSTFYLDISVINFLASSLCHVKFSIGSERKNTLSVCFKKCIALKRQIPCALLNGVTRLFFAVMLVTGVVSLCCSIRILVLTLENHFPIEMADTLFATWRWIRNVLLLRHHTRPMMMTRVSFKPYSSICSILSAMISKILGGDCNLVLDVDADKKGGNLTIPMLSA